MAFPSKFTNLDRSILAKISVLILDDVETITLSELINLRLNNFEDISEFMLALDVLFVLEKIELEKDKGVIKYVN
ncbi:ABC-three component system middle component 7 [Cellulosispirillum alkaliphilum]|uniref:ABC-three component system middle component 7 n=1 Tax=Cellulosispirillum alkaliphilum TaxID=3039283 RepID=UPI003D6DACBD